MEKAHKNKNLHLLPVNTWTVHRKVQLLPSGRVDHAAHLPFFLVYFFVTNDINDCQGKHNNNNNNNNTNDC